MACFHPPGDCPNCGEDVPAGAKACPHCGSDERSGWDEDAAYLDGVNLPGEGLDYDRILAHEQPSPRPRGGRAWLALGIGVVLAAALLLAWLRG